MTKTTYFDVLIVYSDRLAASASSVSKDISAPFSKGSGSESYNIVYSYFLGICEKHNLKAAFTTSADITAAGRCRSYWLFDEDAWVKVRKTGYSEVIFDKFSPINKRIEDNRNLLFSSRKVKSINHPWLFDLFFDKQKTYERLYKFSIPTVAIGGSTAESLNKAQNTLKEIISRHPNKKDFSDEIIMKDRFGAGGINVFKLKIDQTDEMARLLKMHNRKSFIIQAFVKFDKGFSYQNSPVSADIRLIYLGGEIVQSYIRMAKAGDFRCNEHRGGTLKYIPIGQVPMNLVTISNKVARVVNKKSSLFALDFIISNNDNVYLLEGNTGPGLDWNLSIKENELEAQKLIRIIVKELYKLARPVLRTTKKEGVDIAIGAITADEEPALPDGLVLS